VWEVCRRRLLEDEAEIRYKEEQHVTFWVATASVDAMLTQFEWEVGNPSPSC